MQCWRMADLRRARSTAGAPPPLGDDARAFHQGAGYCACRVSRLVGPVEGKFPSVSALPIKLVACNALKDGPCHFNDPMGPTESALLTVVAGATLMFRLFLSR